MKKTILYFALVLSILGCIDRKIVRDLKIVNTLNHDVYILNTFNDSLDKTFAGWDTAIFDQLYLAKRNSVYFIQNKPSDWKSYIELSPQGKMRIYVIPVEMVNTHGWKYIFKNYSTLEPMKIDYAYLKKCDFQIIINK